MQNRRRNIYWSHETDSQAVNLAWEKHQSVSQFLTDLVSAVVNLATPEALLAPLPDDGN